MEMREEGEDEERGNFVRKKKFKLKKDRLDLVPPTKNQKCETKCYQLHT
jgi:hypothetical protein